MISPRQRQWIALITNTLKQWGLVTLALGILILSISCGKNVAAPIALAPSAAAASTRNPWLWPFAVDSIWNMPIGSNATYAPAKLPPVDWLGADVDWLLVIPAGSPMRPLYDPGDWEKRCQGQTTYENLTIPIPDDLIVPDAIVTPTQYSTPNNAAALLQPDGRTIIQLEPMARCVKGGPVYGYRWPKENLTLDGSGIAGGHLGSGLSSIGGTIRSGELTGDTPIRHALKIELWEQYLHYDANDPTPGYRWPADRADGAAAEIYKGKNPAIVMGSLFAIPPQVTERSLGLTTVAGKQLFHALQDYGAYQVDATGQPKYNLVVDQTVEAEFAAAYGYPMELGAIDNNPYYRDVMQLMQALNVITNNQPNAIGGGGQPRTALAPPLPPRSISP
jgi:hypothetical protein